MLVVPRPDESTYSLIYRAANQSGIDNPRAALRYLTGVSGYKPMAGLPSQVEFLVERINLGFPVERLIERHTFVPLYRPFISTIRLASVLDAMLNGGSAKARLGLLRSHCGADERLAYCAHCNRDSLETFGHAFWKRSHTSLGSFTCADHQVPLSRLGIESLPWKERALIGPIGGKSPSISDDQLEKLFFISSELAQILNASYSTMDSVGVWNELLRERGLVTRTARLRCRRITAAVRRWLKPIREFEPFGDLYESLSVDRSWIASTVSGDSFSHPLKHLVILGSIDASWQEFVSVSMKPGSQLALDLRVTRKHSPTTDEFLQAMRSVRSVSQAAAKLGCDVNTALILADKCGVVYTRRSKSIDGAKRDQILRELLAGDSSTIVANRHSEKWTPLVGQCGSVFKVESDIVIMLPVRAV